MGFQNPPLHQPTSAAGRPMDTSPEEWLWKQQHGYRPAKASKEIPKKNHTGFGHT